MRLTDEIDALEQRMVETNARDRDMAGVVALGCFALLALCWMIAAVWP